jgi:hypothetical protein
MNDQFMGKPHGQWQIAQRQRRQARAGSQAGQAVMAEILFLLLRMSPHKIEKSSRTFHYIDQLPFRCL